MASMGIARVMMHVLTRRRSCDEVEQTWCLELDRAASRGDECAKCVSAGVVGVAIFVDLGVVSPV
jgi:hypothetical protein